MARVCLFCSRRADSAEHVYPLWISRRFNKNASPRGGFTMNFDGLYPTRWTRTLNQRVKVCRTCNNGWMSQLENSSRHVLDPLITGTPCRLAADEQAVLARWLLKNALLHEVLLPLEIRSVGQAQREEFARGGPLPGWDVCIGAMRPEDGRGGSWTHQPGSLITWDDHKRGPPSRGRLHTTAFGHLTAQVVVHSRRDPPRFGGLLGGAGWAISICPSSGPASWPPPERFTLEWLLAVANPQFTQSK
jgi:hypothetical protein